MPIVSERGAIYRWIHHGSGYSSGATQTVEHNVVPASAFIAIHTGISAVQATNLGPLGAAIGVMKVDNMDFGPNSADWPGVAYSKLGKWTLAMQVTKGEMNVWEVSQAWN